MMLPRCGDSGTDFSAGCPTALIHWASPQSAEPQGARPTWTGQSAVPLPRGQPALGSWSRNLILGSRPLHSGYLFLKDFGLSSDARRQSGWWVGTVGDGEAWRLAWALHGWLCV